MVGGHATSFGTAELRENSADTDVVYLCGVKVGEFIDCGFEDLESRSQLYVG